MKKFISVISCIAILMGSISLSAFSYDDGFTVALSKISSTQDTMGKTQDE